MATPAQIANDLDARAKLLEHTQMADHARAMRRGAKIIRDMSNALAGELEALAALINDKVEQDRFDATKDKPNGD